MQSHQTTRRLFRMSTLAAALALGASVTAWAQQYSDTSSLTQSTAESGAPMANPSAPNWYRSRLMPASTMTAEAAEPSVTVADTTLSTPAAMSASTPNFAPRATPQRMRSVNSSSEVSIAAVDDASASASDGLESVASTEPSLMTDEGISLQLDASSEDVVLVAFASEGAPAQDDSRNLYAATDLSTPPESVSREQVRDELAAAREAGTLVEAGEIANTPRVVAARERFNEEQAEAIIAEYRAEQDRQIALAEAEVRRAEIEAEGVELAAMAAALDDPNAEIRIEVIELQGE